MAVSLAAVRCTTLQRAACFTARARPRCTRSSGRTRWVCRAEDRESGDRQDPPAAAVTEEPSPPSRENENLQLPAEVIQRMRDTVFGFDSFFVTSVENYQASE